MKRLSKPTPEPPPIDRARVGALLRQANAARERGRLTPRHPALTELGELCGVLAEYIFVWYPDDYHLSAADIDVLTDGLVRMAAP